MCAALLVRSLLEHMMRTRRECTRCMSELVLLFSMWQGLDTNFVAVLAWLAWLQGLHCGSLFSCRCMTWLLVCLSQRDLWTARLIFLSFLAFIAPLYGKRTSLADTLVEPCNKKLCVDEDWSGDAYALSLSLFNWFGQVDCPRETS